MIEQALGLCTCLITRHFFDQTKGYLQCLCFALSDFHFLAWAARYSGFEGYNSGMPRFDCFIKLHMNPRELVKQAAGPQAETTAGSF